VGVALESMISRAEKWLIAGTGRPIVVPDLHGSVYL
jgi:hypothetical protein